MSFGVKVEALDGLPYIPYLSHFISSPLSLAPSSPAVPASLTLHPQYSRHAPTSGPLHLVFPLSSVFPQVSSWLAP